MLLALGITFEVPIVIGFLAWMGLVNWRQLLNFSRWWVVISAVLAAVLTPSGDAGTMMLVLAPLVVLYYLAIAIAWVVGPKPPPEPPKDPVAPKGTKT
jgi:sec-independent protein translocase protein TatC